MISEVVIDRRLLDQFKRRAFRAHPNETAEQLWGCIRGRKAHVCHIEPIDIERQTKHEVDFTFDQDCGSKHGKLKLLGSIHTHPGEYGTEPSDEDIDEAQKDGEIVWGIYAVRKAGKRRFISCRFWSTVDGQLELVIAE